jgi:hypothetical protein
LGDWAIWAVRARYYVFYVLIVCFVLFCFFVISFVAIVSSPGSVATVTKPEYIDLDFVYYNKKKAPFGFTDSLDSSNGDEEEGNN